MLHKKELLLTVMLTILLFSSLFFFFIFSWSLAFTCRLLQKNTHMEQHSCTAGDRYNNICFITLSFSLSFKKERETDIS